MIILAVMLSIGIWGCNYNTQNEEEVRVAVEIAQVKKSSISEEITITSKLQPIKNMMIIPKTPGLEVTKLAVNVGDAVKKGDFLFELDKTLIRRQVEAARKTYHQAQRNYQIQQEQAERARNLPVSIAATGMGFQSSSQSMTKEMLDTSLLTAEAQLDQARLTYVNTLEQLDEMEYYAPIDGIITTNNLQKNQMVMNTQPALVISDIKQLKMDLYVTKATYKALNIGDELLFYTEGVEERGKVTMINNVADLRTNLYNVQITVDNEKEELLAGSFCTIMIERGKKENTLVIPKSAVFYEGNTPTVFVENQERPVKRPIELGIDGGEFVEVLNGLMEKETIIIKGQHYIDENTLIMVVRGEEDEDI